MLPLVQVLSELEDDQLSQVFLKMDGRTGVRLLQSSESAEALFARMGPAAAAHVAKPMIVIAPK